VLAISSDRKARTHRFESGACIWLYGAASRPGTRPSSLWHVSSLCYSIASGRRKNRMYLSTQKLPEDRPCLLVATTPCSDDCERVLVLEAEREMAASTLLSNPTGTELASRQLIQSAYRNPVESNMRRNETRNNNKSKSPMKEKAKNKP
jgi:hypothetical protein